MSSQSDVDLPEGGRSPICRGILQHSVGAHHAQDGRVMHHFPQGHGVGHGDALAVLRGASSVGIEQDTFSTHMASRAWHPGALHNIDGLSAGE